MRTRLWLACLCTYILTSAYQTRKDAPTVHRMRQLEEEYIQHAYKVIPNDLCTSNSITIRKEWETLSKTNKEEFLGAIDCLRAQPPKSKVPIAQSRHDDFVLAHILHTREIHYSGLLLPWHRYFLHLFEQAIRNECGYRGPLPYWDWSKYAANSDNATIFDGSRWSMSSNGLAVAHSTISVELPGGAPPRLSVNRPPGTGGGCIESGPFENYTIHVDAVTIDNGSGIYTTDVFSNPRCIVRDNWLPLLAQCNSYQNVTDLILDSHDIHAFHTSIEDLECGVHGTGHVFLGGENMNLFASPNDPIFFLHHANLDRIWSIWQSLDLNSRTYALDGTLTFMNYPISPNATISDMLEYDDWVEPVTIGSVMDPLQSELCYIYV